jgi:hypothetical protein
VALPGYNLIKINTTIKMLVHAHKSIKLSVKCGYL